MTPPNKDLATIAILDTKLTEAISQITELKGRFDTFQSSFLRQDIYNIKHEELIKQVAINANEIQNMKKDSDKSRWVVPTTTFIVGTVISALVIYTLTHR